MFRQKFRPCFKFSKHEVGIVPVPRGALVKTVVSGVSYSKSNVLRPKGDVPIRVEVIWAFLRWHLSAL